jgi:hypothetical protein
MCCTTQGNPNSRANHGRVYLSCRPSYASGRSHRCALFLSRSELERLIQFVYGLWQLQRYGSHDGTHGAQGAVPEPTVLGFKVEESLRPDPLCRKLFGRGPRDRG